VNEERVDEVGRREDVLAHHAPHRLALAVAPRPRALIHPRAAAHVAAQHVWRHLDALLARPHLRPGLRAARRRDELGRRASRDARVRRKAEEAGRYLQEEERRQHHARPMKGFQNGSTRLCFLLTRM